MSEKIGITRNHNIPTIKMCIYSHFQQRKRPNNCFISYRLTIIVVKVHVPPKEKRRVSEVARVRQRLKNVACSASAASVEIAKLLCLLARIGYVCELNVLDGIFYLCLHIIPHYIYCLSYFVVGRRWRKYHVLRDLTQRATVNTEKTMILSQGLWISINTC
jgi:hypothetical protein